MKLDASGSGRPTRRTGVPRRYLTILVWVVFAALLANGFASVVRYPWYNWDLVSYVGLSLARHTPPEELHARTFEEIEATVPRVTFRNLTGAGSDGYRARVRRDPESFRQQLRFCTNRPLYNGAIALLQAVGLRPVPSTYWVSALSIAGVCILLMRWCLAEIGFWALLALPVFVVTCALQPLARASTPDGLTALILVAAVVLVVRGATRTGVGLLVLSVAARPDALLFALPVVVYLGFLAPGSFRLRPMTCAIAAASVLLLYLGIDHWTNPHGWRTVMHNSFVARLTYPSDETDLISIPEFLSLLYPRAVAAMTRIDNFPIPFYNRGIAFVPAALLVAFLIRRASEATRIYGHLALLSAGYIVVHFVAFPEMEARFFGAQFVVIVMAAIQALRLLASRRPETRPAPVSEGV